MQFFLDLDRVRTDVWLKCDDYFMIIFCNSSNNEKLKKMLQQYLEVMKNNERIKTFLFKSRNFDSNLALHFDFLIVWRESRIVKS